MHEIFKSITTIACESYKNQIIRLHIIHASCINSIDEKIIRLEKLKKIIQIQNYLNVNLFECWCISYIADDYLSFQFFHDCKQVIIQMCEIHSDENIICFSYNNHYTDVSSALVHTNWYNHVLQEIKLHEM